MNDALLIQGAYAQVRIREPEGERTLGERISVGGATADVVVPGVEAGGALAIERRKGIWVVAPASAAVIRFNGRPLTSARDLRRHDVLALGDAQVLAPQQRTEKYAIAQCADDVSTHAALCSCSRSSPPGSSRLDLAGKTG